MPDDGECAAFIIFRHCNPLYLFRPSAFVELEVYDSIYFPNLHVRDGKIKQKYATCYNVVSLSRLQVVIVVDICCSFDFLKCTGLFRGFFQASKSH